jgi:hypothetical protein
MAYALSNQDRTLGAASAAIVSSYVDVRQRSAFFLRKPERGAAYRVLGLPSQTLPGGYAPRPPMKNDTTPNQKIIRCRIVFEVTQVAPLRSGPP